MRGLQPVEQRKALQFQLQGWLLTLPRELCPGAGAGCSPEPVDVRSLPLAGGVEPL